MIEPSSIEPISKTSFLMWQNDALTVYHGTDLVSANAILHQTPEGNHRISLSRCSPITDFGLGFFTTTNLAQAKQWANQRIRNSLSKDESVESVIQFVVERSRISALTHMAFVRAGSSPNSDFWRLGINCRNGNDHHGLSGESFFDVVYGPVSLFPQQLIIADADQISFHTQNALTVLENPTTLSTASPTF